MAYVHRTPAWLVQCSVIESCASREAYVGPLLAHEINQVPDEKIVLYFCCGLQWSDEQRFPSAAISVPLAFQVPLKGVQESSKISKDASVSTATVLGF